MHFRELVGGFLFPFSQSCFPRKQHPTETSGSLREGRTGEGRGRSVWLGWSSLRSFYLSFFQECLKPMKASYKIPNTQCEDKTKEPSHPTCAAFLKVFPSRDTERETESERKRELQRLPNFPNCKNPKQHGHSPSNLSSPNPTMQQKAQKQTMQEPKQASRTEKREVGEVMGFLSFFLSFSLPSVQPKRRRHARKEENITS